MGTEDLSVRKTLGLILAGGASQRFGSDKRLAELDGRTLIEAVIRRAAPQVGSLALSAAKDPAGLCLPVIPDITPGEGPLGGVLAGLHYAAAHDFSHLATFPCDTPFFPEDLVRRQHRALSHGADIAMARCCDDIHAAFALIHVAKWQTIEEAYLGGLRSLKALGGVLPCALTDFGDGIKGPNGDCFFNINTSRDLEFARTYLRGGGHGL